MDERILQAFFFRAMTSGWVVDSGETRIAGIPEGYRGFEFPEGHLRLTDVYFKHPASGRSAGTTTIFYEGVPVWIMYYRGFYAQRAIPYLKKLLLATYQRGEFIGGRGPFWHQEGGLLYTNFRDESLFRHFSGHEEIVDIEAGQTLGCHEYMGGTLI